MSRKYRTHIAARYREVAEIYICVTGTYLR